MEHRKTIPQLTITECQDEFQNHHPCYHTLKPTELIPTILVCQQTFFSRSQNYYITNAPRIYQPWIDFIIYLIFPSEPDVNVHPNKTEIKLCATQIIHAMTSGL